MLTTVFDITLANIFTLSLERLTARSDVEPQTSPSGAVLLGMGGGTEHFIITIPCNSVIKVFND